MFVRPWDNKVVSAAGAVEQIVYQDDSRGQLETIDSKLNRLISLFAELVELLPSDVQEQLLGSYGWSRK